jgi:hypothetical protein
MFEWNSHENCKSLFGKAIKKVFTERETLQFDSTTLTDSRTSSIASDYYKQRVEKAILEHNYADRIKIKIDSFEYSYKVYEAVKNYFINHEGYNIETEYLPSPYAVFVKRQ